MKLGTGLYVPSSLGIPLNRQPPFVTVAISPGELASLIRTHKQSIEFLQQSLDTLPPDMDAWFAEGFEHRINALKLRVLQLTLLK